MSIQITLPDELAARIDELSDDRDAFVTEAVRQFLHQSPSDNADEVRRINEVADDLNREARDVLEYQVIS